MAVFVYCEDPVALRSALIEQTKRGDFETWQYINSKFRHTPDQWFDSGYIVAGEVKKGYFSATVGFGPELQTAEEKDYFFGLVQGRFIELLLCHFGKRLTKLIVQDRRGGKK